MNDLAYHYGDLGKSEYRHSFGNRGTGGFGTGVYFVGTPISQRNDSFGYRNRPEHKVDFSEYKLFRPTSNSKAYDLHDALLTINNLFSDNDVVPDTPDNILSEYSAVTKEYFSPVDELPEDDYVTPITLDEKILWRYIDKYKDYYNGEISSHDDPLDIAGVIEDNLLEDARVFERAVRKLVSALGYNYSEDKIRDLIATAVKDTSDIAPSTLIMKALGYDGIDVRHLNHDAESLQGLDNFGYGSVIYDVKSTSVIDESYIENKNKTGANMRKLINQINNVNDQDFDDLYVGTAPVSYADAVIRMRKKRKEIGDMLTQKTNDARSALALKTGVKISLDEELFEGLTEESNNVSLAKEALNEIIERIHLGMSGLEELLDLDISDDARSRIDDAASDIAQVLDRLSLIARKYLKESFDDEHLGHEDDVCPKCGKEPCECKVEEDLYPEYVSYQGKKMRVQGLRPDGKYALSEPEYSGLDVTDHPEYLIDVDKDEVESLEESREDAKIFRVTYKHSPEVFSSVMIKAEDEDEAKKKLSVKHPSKDIVGVQVMSDDEVKDMTHRGMSLIEAVVLQQFSDYQPWEGAIDTYERIKSANKLDALDRLIEEMYPDGIDMTELNDLLWFDSEWVFSMLNIPSEDEEV